MNDQIDWNSSEKLDVFLSSQNLNDETGSRTEQGTEPADEQRGDGAVNPIPIWTY